MFPRKHRAPKKSETTITHRLIWRARAVLVMTSIFGLAPVWANAQTGVDDDRVSLPEGPGSLEGVGDNVEIDPNMGAMRYGVSVPIPSGQNGMTPATSLSYSSSAPTGVLGVGWSMQMPSIERMTARGIPLYGTGDTFVFNGGTELVLVDDSGDDLVYRDRFERDFRRYTWVNARATDGSDYWKVEYPDGSVGYFGARADGARQDSARTIHDSAQALALTQDTFAYHLVAQVDAFGNRVIYEYDKADSNVPLLDTISYGFGDQDAPLYRVQLSYSTRIDPISNADGGFETVLNHRLDGMAILAEDEIIREVELIYQDAAITNGITRLGQVTQWGLAGKAGGVKDPVEYSFDYQRGLGAECTEADCAKPYVVDMGMLPGGVSLDSGFATLVDINGDALPDIVDTSQAGPHRFYLNTITADLANPGAFSYGFAAGYDSAVGDGGTLQLGENVQTLDVNGDGYADLINTSTGAFLIKDPEKDDWKAVSTSVDVDELRNVSAETRRFLDYNGDKKIDVLVGTAAQTQVYENTGDDFVPKSVEFIGLGFDSANLQLADMNGDGISDPTEVDANGVVRYRINLGWGRWEAEWRTISGDPLSPLERQLVELEDLNGDSLDDLVIVDTSQIKYAINRGDHFDSLVTIDTANIPELPTRENGTQVLYADMNANGSEDIVWLTSGQPVRYLELFPQRPNLISEVRNGVGNVQKVEYTTAALQAAVAAASSEPWQKSLQIPMPIVARTDTYVTLTGASDGSGLHDISEYVYRNGFYDGVEKQFRGFAIVEQTMQESDSQQGGMVRSVFDLGDQDVYRNGLQTSASVSTGGAIIRDNENEYEDCTLTDVPDAATLQGLGRYPVRYVCMTAETTTHQEGAPEAEHITTRTVYAYDGYGNVTTETMLGDLAVEGDELITETTYTEPSTLWQLGLPATEEVFVNPAGDRKLTTYYYDGDDFEGLVAGEVTHGFLTRMTVKADADTTLESLRRRRDRFGNTVEIIDANGSLDDTTTHRRKYTYGKHGLFPILTDLLLEDETGPYLIRRDSRYDVRWQEPTLISDWYVHRDGQDLTPKNTTTIVYDELGRMSMRVEPGDDPATPSTTYTYDLGDPISTIKIAQRSRPDGPLDEEALACFDGRGQQYQGRSRIADGQWLVTGFTVFNARGAEVESFQPYTSDSPDCETARPTEVLSVLTRYDALFRPIESTFPDGGIYGEPSTQRYEYKPLQEIFYDAEDTLTGGPHENTPTTRHRDGLDRVRLLERTLSDGIAASYTLHYDNTGSFAGYTDPSGHRHELVVDLADRITRVINPNTGAIDFTHDGVGNVMTQSDARGVTMKMAYDGANRLVERWESSDREGTLVSWRYDFAGSCPSTTCTQPANRLVASTYPLVGAQGSVARGEHRRGYDARGRQITTEVLWGDVSMTMKETYDNADRVINTTYPGGVELPRSYDGAGRVIAVGGFVDQVGYSEQGQLASLAYSNGTRSEIDFDAMLRIASITHLDGASEIIEKLGFARDRVDNILTIQDGTGRADIPNAQSSFGYDAWYRLTSAQVVSALGEERIDYGFDLLDNTEQVVSSLGSMSPAHVGQMSYSAQKPNALTAAGEMAYSYDAMGNMAERGSAQLTWDYLNRLTSYSSDGIEEHYMYGGGPSQVASVSQDSLSFYAPDLFEVHDGIATTYAKVGDIRVGRHESTALMTSIYPDIVEDGSINAADAYALSTGQDASAPFEAAKTVKRILGASAARMLIDAQGGPITFLHTDHLGSITVATDRGGAVQGHRGYYPTGVLRWSEGHVDRYGFTGQEEMSTGLTRFAYRSLDPHIGRWTSFDPNFLRLTTSDMEKFGDATSGYAYVANNFANTIDVLGLGPPGKKSSSRNLASKGSKEKTRRGKKASSAQDAAKPKPPSVKAPLPPRPKAPTVQAPAPPVGAKSAGVPDVTPPAGARERSGSNAREKDSALSRLFDKAFSPINKMSQKYTDASDGNARSNYLPESTLKTIERGENIRLGMTLTSTTLSIIGSIMNIVFTFVEP